eukprot:4264701-Pleurochrysis_carterae.AAC.1
MRRAKCAYITFPVLYFLLRKATFFLKYRCGSQPTTAMRAEKGVAVSILAFILQHFRPRLEGMEMHRKMGRERSNLVWKTGILSHSSHHHFIIGCMRR